MKFGALLVTGADGVRRQYDLDAPSVLVGSGVGSGVLLSDASVAERHAKLVVESGVLLVEDMGSESGTAVSGRRVTPHVPNRVEPGQELRFGSVSALYLEPPPMEVEPLPGTRPEAAGDDEADFRPFSRVLLTLSLPRAPLAAGNRYAASLRVENRGRVVDEVSLRVTGIPQSWVMGWRPSVRLVTGGTIEIPLSILPPLTPEALAGAHDVIVTATSGTDGRQQVTIGTIEVLPFESLRLAVDPPRSEDLFHVVTANEGNHDLRVQLEVPEPDERLDFEVEAAAFTLKPGEVRRTGLHAGMRHRPLFGRREIIAFVVAANAHEAAFDRVETFGQLHVKPPLQPWRFALQLLVALAIVGAVVAVFWFDWPVRADVGDFNVPAIPGLYEKDEAKPSPTVAKPAATALAGAKKEDSSAALAKLEEQYAGVHLCGTAKTTPTPTAAPSPAAAGAPFRQNDAAWANEIYAAAGQPGPKSTCGKTLAQCGCQVTSMATVLALLKLVTMPDGSRVDPGSLNRWFALDATQDAVGWSSRGYAYGDVVWSVANALSAQAAKSSPGTPKLRFLGAGSGNDDEIKSALDAGVPVILEVPGHYIAATGYDAGKIAIADPYYPDRKTLDFYKGKVLGSVLFQPADDLSAITVTVGSDMRVRVTDPSGRVTGTVEGATPNEAEARAKRDIPSSSYTFKDAWRDPNCIESAPPVGAGVHQVQITAPAAGPYKVEITNAKGGGTAAVIHVYDKDGNLRVQHEEGTGNQTVTVRVG